jgi:uncharacterized membrane protein
MSAQSYEDTHIALLGQDVRLFQELVEILAPSDMNHLSNLPIFYLTCRTIKATMDEVVATEYNSSHGTSTILKLMCAREVWHKGVVRVAYTNYRVARVAFKNVRVYEYGVLDVFRAGVSIDIPWADGNTTLYMALLYEDLNLVEKLMEFNPNVKLGGYSSLWEKIDWVAAHYGIHKKHGWERWQTLRECIRIRLRIGVDSPPCF